MLTLKASITALALLAASTTASLASVFDFSFTPALGSITASGSFTADSGPGFLTSVTQVSGTVNGVAIKGIASGVNLFAPSLLSATFSFSDVNGVGYDLANFLQVGVAQSSDGTSAVGALTISPATVSAVPLPASAPLFGTVLLGLAGLGYAANRKKAAAAA